MGHQYTPTYHRMWNRDFSLLIASELLLCMSCYMTIPFLPYRLLTGNCTDTRLAGLTMVTFVAGICLSGFFGSWLIQRYRRNKVFLMSAVCLSAVIFGISLFDTRQGTVTDNGQIAALMGVCLVGGMTFGQAKRVLSCTLLIDKTESCHRTDANYAAIWIARLAVVTGPIIAMTLWHELHGSLFYAVSAAGALIAGLMVMAVKFPFRAPEEDTRLISIDRFFLPRGWNIALVITLMTASLGIVMATHMNVEFLTSLICGLIIAVLTLHYKAVRTGRYTSAVGNLCIMGALVAMTLHDGVLDNTLKAMVLGIGFGLTNSEQLYKLLDCCNHCQRSTAESTYFVSSDGGLFLGIAAVCGVMWDTPINHTHGEYAALCLICAATVICCINSLIKKKIHKEYHA